MSWLRSIVIAMGLMAFAVPSITPTIAFAETWREANSDSVRLYRAGRIEDAARKGERAAELYARVDNYNSTNHATLAIQSSQMYSVVENYRKAAAVLRDTISTVESHSDADVVLIGLYDSLSQAEAFRGARQGNGERAYSARKATIRVAERAYGENDPRTAQILMEVAYFASQISEIQDANLYIGRAHNIMAASGLPDTHPLYVGVDMQQAALELKQERYRSAESMYQGLAMRLRGGDGSNAEMLSVIYTNLAEIYANTDQHDLMDDLVLTVASTRELEQDINALFVPTIDVPARVLGSSAHAIEVTLTIDEYGHVAEVTIVNAGDLGRYSNQIEAAIRQAHFVPLTRNGTAVRAENVSWVYTIND